MQLERYIPPSFETVLDGATPKRALRFASFGAPKEVVPPAPPPPPTFSEAELKTAEQASYRKGFVEGETEGKNIAESQMAQVERNIESLMTPLAEQLLEQMKHYNHFVREEAKSAPYIASAVAKKIAGEALSADTLPLLERQVKDCIATMLGTPKIVVTVSEALAERFEQKLTAYFTASNEPGDIIIHGDASMKETDCTVEWAHGMARISHAERLQQIDQLVAEIAADRTFNHQDYTPNQGEAT